MGIETLTQEGGNRWADKGPVLAAIEAALALAPDDEIREAFGLGDWRVVTEAHRTRYGEYFAPKVYKSIMESMWSGLAGGRLAVKDFATFTAAGVGEGELFPVSSFGACREVDMVLVDVTIAPHSENDLSIKQTYEGSWSRWRDGIVGNVVEGFCAEYASYPWGAGISEAVEFFVVPAKLAFILDYGGLLQVERRVVGGLAVKGHINTVFYGDGGLNVRNDLVIDDAAPELVGPLRQGGAIYSVSTAQSFGGPLRAWEYVREPLDAYSIYSNRQIDALAGKTAEGMLLAGDVHRVAWGDLPLNVEAWGNCFPRKKWVVRIEHEGGSGLVTSYEPVQWVNRTQWEASYGSHRAEFEALGCVVPEPLVGERAPPVRVYASFAPSFVADLNDGPAGG